MQTQKISINLLEQNMGQIEGLPNNPRQWTVTDVDKLAASIVETPELLECRPLIVTPVNGVYIILGGNLRYEALRSLKREEAPCVVMPENTPISKLKEIVIKDNGSFGAWDYDALANEWDNLALCDWGVPVWNTEKIDEGAVNNLFEEYGENKDKGLTIHVQLPSQYEDNLEDIIKSIELTLEEYPGCKVK